VVRARRDTGAAGKGYPGQLRIIGGRWRRRLLPVPASLGLRPTPNRIRETLFNWLQPVLPGARCLDLFAGTGALCLEALSRGAAAVVMVEQAPKVVAMLEENLQRLAAEHATVVNSDAETYLAGPVSRFDIIFVDPPFANDLIGPCVHRIAEREWCKPGGLVYIEAPSRLIELPLPAGWRTTRSKRTGQVGYHLLQAPQ